MYRVNWRRAGVACLLLVLVCGGLFWAARTFNRGPQQPLALNDGQTAKPAAEEDDPYIVVGGIKRRQSEVASRGPKVDKDVLAKLEREADYGMAPAVKPDTNDNTKSVLEGARERRAERLSVLIQPAAFDAKAFAADPKAYLSVAEPGRVFQPAQPGPGVPRLTRLSPVNTEIRQGKSTVLRVHALPGAPVTFTSLDLGRFQNMLSTVTVQANDRGEAQAEFTATSGTIGRARVLAASPLASGQTRFVINISRAANKAPANANAAR